MSKDNFRTLAFVSMFVCISIGCASVTKPRARFPTPRPVAQAADLMATKYCTNALQRAAYHDAFVSGVWSALTWNAAKEAEEYAYAGPDPSKSGMADALRAMLGQPRMRELAGITLQDYGYTYVVTSGVCKSAFELSVFGPDQSDERWWLTVNKQFVEMQRAFMAAGDHSNMDSRMIIYTLAGYLSPLTDGPDIGGYGHLSQYKREFFVDRVVEMNVKSK